MTASPIQLVDLINIRGFDPNLFSMLKDVPVLYFLICLNADVYSIEKDYKNIIRWIQNPRKNVATNTIT